MKLCNRNQNGTLIRLIVIIHEVGPHHHALSVIYKLELGIHHLAVSTIYMVKLSLQHWAVPNIYRAHGRFCRHSKTIPAIIADDIV